jgi:hypothetical protein
MSARGPVLAAAVLGALLAASAARHGGTGGHAAAAQSGYVNPLAGQSWTLARTDQGVDYRPDVPTPVRAIGDGTVIFSDSRDCAGPPRYGWPGCHMISYRLTAGPDKGGVIFVAEHLTSMLPVGTRVWPGRPVAVAWPGYPWTEWGWANCAGTTPVVQYHGNADGSPMPGGKAFARFMRGLGAATRDDPGPGPDIMRSC